MSKKSRKVAGRTIAEWEALSAELDEEMSTAPENTSRPRGFAPRPQPNKRLKKAKRSPSAKVKKA